MAGKVIGIDNLKRELNAMRASKITVGIQGSSGAAAHPEGDGVSVAEVARYMEFGTRTVPARPFMRTTFQQHKDKFKAAARRALSDVIDGRSPPDEAMADLGEAGVAAVQATIDTAADWAKPLALNTVHAKQSSQPLVDTGTLRNSVTWEIKK